MSSFTVCHCSWLLKGKHSILTYVHQQCGEHLCDQKPWVSHHHNFLLLLHSTIHHCWQHESHITQGNIFILQCGHYNSICSVHEYWYSRHGKTKHLWCFQCIQHHVQLIFPQIYHLGQEMVIFTTIIIIVQPLCSSETCKIRVWSFIVTFGLVELPVFHLITIQCHLTIVNHLQNSQEHQIN